MKEIKLSQQGKNKGKYVALVDDENYEFLNQWRWHTCGRNNNIYAVRNKKQNNGKILLMHRLIMNTPDNIETDHKDGNGLNCQKNNMRNCTHLNNMHNRKSHGWSKYLGVTFTKYNSKIKIVARIKVNGIQKYLGIFKTEELAALAYNEAAKKYHGEFANLNVILQVV